MLRTDPFDPCAIGRLVDRVFPRPPRATVERVEEGVSTHVYRIRRGRDTFYLRALPEEGAGFAPEAHAHALLRRRGVRVPEIVYVADRDDALGRSAMVTTEVKGRHVGHCHDLADVRRVLVEAGHDLAIINAVPVEGFGWIKRTGDAGDRLAADYPDYRAFALDHMEEHLALLGAHALDAREAEAIERVIARHDALLDGTDARLAHGDFDVTHIYQDGGRYTGIIDFGEIRGADPFYDLGHVNLHDGETLPTRALPYLLEGYRELTPLPPDYERRIHLASLLIAVKALARQIEKYLPGRTGPGSAAHLPRADGYARDFRERPYIMWLAASVKRDIELLQRL